jgi:hypothetical protein
VDKENTMPTAEQWKLIGASAFRNFFTAFLTTLVVASIAVGDLTQNYVTALAVSGAVGGFNAVLKVLVNWFRSGYTDFGVGSDA